MKFAPILHNILLFITKKKNLQKDQRYKGYGQKSDPRKLASTNNSS